MAIQNGGRRTLDCFVASLLAMTGGGEGRGRSYEAAGGVHHGHGTLYTGVTSDLVKRVWRHRAGVSDGFAKRYGCKLLVWFEVGGDMRHAIARDGCD